MLRSLKLADQVSRPKPSLDHWAFAALVAMALIVIVLFTLLPGDKSLSALQAAMATH